MSRVENEQWKLFNVVTPACYTHACANLRIFTALAICHTATAQMAACWLLAISCMHSAYILWVLYDHKPELSEMDLFVQQGVDDTPVAFADNLIKPSVTL